MQTVVLHYSIKSILDKIQEISGNRAKFITEKPNANLIISSDEDSLTIDFLRNALTSLYSSMSSVSKYVDEPVVIDTEITIETYFEQTEFLKNSVLDVDGNLHKCLQDTENPPNSIYDEWLQIDDEIRVYFIMMLNDFWDSNVSISLERNVFNYLCNSILSDWYRICGADKEVKYFTDEMEKNLTDAKSNTYKRTKPIVRTSTFP